jgi:putative glutamine amidotransferase
MTAPLRIGISACFFHPDPQRALFKGKTLLYAEQSLVHWAMGLGDVAFVVPPPSPSVPAVRLVAELDALVLHGGADIAPETYGEQAQRPEWAGDRIRDLYELELLSAFLDEGKPVLGICRGAQLLNVHQGGTLYQDLVAQLAGGRVHRDWDVYDRHFHELLIEPGSWLAGWAGGVRARVSSVHHQGIKELGKGLVVEARAAEDGVVEALRLQDERWVYAVQWHPEFHDPEDADVLDGGPLLEAFLGAARARRGR